MPATQVRSFPHANPTQVVPATSVGVGSAIPTGDGFVAPETGTVRTLIAYAGTVTAANVRLWIRNSGTGVWHRAASTDSLDPLAPGGAAPINEVRDWKIGRGVEFLFRVETVTGGGTVAVAVIGVDA